MRIYWVSAFIVLLLILRFLFFFETRPEYKDGQGITFSFMLMSAPQVISNQQSFTANLPNGERVLIKTKTENSFGFGDNLIISGNLKNKVISTRSRIWVISPAVVKTSSNNLLLFKNMREKISVNFNHMLPQDLASLLMGIVFGIKGSMSQSFSEEIKNAGVSHVISASGMNVVMVSVFLSSIFGFLFKRQWALSLSLLGIISYAAFAGFQPSIVRASIMGGMVFVSQIVGRQSWGAWGLFLTAFIMLFISPQLILDISFQLSVAATFGVLFISPLIQRGKARDFLEKSFIGEDIILTLSAQAATLPILISNFGTYSIFSLLANALVLWTVAPLMILGGFGAIFGLIYAPLGQIFIYLALPILSYFEKMISIFGSGGVFQIGNLSWEIILGYYLVLISLILLPKQSA